MIIVDKALRARQDAGNPIRLGVVGAGFAGRGFVHQVLQATPGMDVAVVANRTLAEAAKAFTDVGIDDFVSVSTARSWRRRSSAVSERSRTTPARHRRRRHRVHRRGHR